MPTPAGGYPCNLRESGAKPHFVLPIEHTGRPGSNFAWVLGLIWDTCGDVAVCGAGGRPKVSERCEFDVTLSLLLPCF